MKLINLTAKNFKQYKELGPIKFPEKGIIGIIGDTGSGKSTIFNAIELGLFGSVSGTKMSELKHRDSKKSDKWSIELDFEFNGILYKVIRHETTSKAELYADDKQIQVGQRAVNEHIEDVVLKMNQEAFLNAFYAKQDDIDSLSKMKNEERKREISTLLGIDDIDKAIKLSRQDKNKLNIQIEELKRHIKNKDELEESLKKSKEKSLESTNTLTKIKKENNGISKKIEKLNSDIKLLEEKERRINTTNTELIKAKNNKTTTENNLENLTKEIEELETLELKLAKYKKEITGIDLLEKEIELSKQYISLEKHLNELKGKLIKQKEKMEGLSKNIKELNVEGLNNELTSLDNDIEKHTKTKSEQDSKLITIKSELKQLKTDGINTRQNLDNIVQLGGESNCPTCKQVLGESFEIIINEYKKQIENLRKLYADKDAEKKEVEKNILKSTQILDGKASRKNEINKILKDNEKLIVSLNTEKGIFTRLKEDYNEFVSSDSGKILNDKKNDFSESELERKSELLNKLKEKRSFYNLSIERVLNKEKLSNSKKEHAKELNKLNIEVDRLKDIIKDENFSESFLSEKRKSLNVFWKNQEQNNNLLNSALITENNLKRDIAELESRKKENDEKLSELASKTKEFKNLLYLDEAFKVYKVKKLSEISPAISMTMSSLLGYLTDGKYDKVTLDEDYNVFVNRNGQDQPYHMFSGGEKKLFSLVQRLAISQIITRQRSTNNFEFLALDEVVGSFDSDKQFTVLESLQKINGIFKQIFMITHNQDLNTMFDFALEVEQNSDLSSNIKWSY